VLDLLVDLNRSRGTTTVMVLHDLNLAARYADHLVGVRSGKLHASGHPSGVLSAEVVQEVFGMDSQVVPGPVSARPMVPPIGRHRVVREARPPDRADGQRATGDGGQEPGASPVTEQRALP
jgi:iron complex transport system ATP-binding protein